MAGGTIQLLVYGAQDMYLTADPQITFFKIVYRRHTNFSIETFEATITEKPNFGKIGKVKIFRLGDLITKMYIKIVLNKVVPNEGGKFAYVRRLGHAVLRSVEIEIDGYGIDKQYGEWLDLWYELTRNSGKERGYLNMIGDNPMLTTYNNKSKPEYVLYIPLKFWFNRFNGLALPLIAIQYQDVYIKLAFNEKEEVIVRNSAFNSFDQITMIDVSILTDYIYLDHIERDLFAYKGHEYLIEQVQYFGDDHMSVPIRRLFLDFNHPSKELFWCMKLGIYTQGLKFLCYTHKDNWEDEIQNCSKQILLDSIILNNNEEDLPDGTWQRVEPEEECTTENGKIDIINDGTKTLWINTDSLCVCGYSITDKISATITLSPDNLISITNLCSTITVRDISIPVEYMNDTRATSDDVCLYQFTNYGLLINGKFNPFEFAVLYMNDQERFKKRNGTFFNYLQPEMHHSSTPADGINIYSFCFFPEQHQPSGTTNFSKIERLILKLWLKDSTFEDELPELPFLNKNNNLYVFTLSYNVLRVMNGLCAVAYIN